MYRLRINIGEHEILYWLDLKLIIIILGAHGLIFTSFWWPSFEKLMSKLEIFPKFPTMLNLIIVVCVSGTALFVASLKESWIIIHSFCWQCTHTDQPTDVRLFVCMLILTVHVIIIFTHSAINLMANNERLSSSIVYSVGTWRAQVRVSVTACLNSILFMAINPP